MRWPKAGGDPRHGTFRYMFDLSKDDIFFHSHLVSRPWPDHVPEVAETHVREVNVVSRMYFKSRRDTRKQSSNARK